MDFLCSPLYLRTWICLRVLFIIYWCFEKWYIASRSLKWMTKSQNYHWEIHSIKWITLVWGGYQGDFSLRSTWPRGLCLVNLPHPWGKFSTLLNQFYNPPGWPGVLPLGQANDMCIKSHWFKYTYALHLIGYICKAFKLWLSLLGSDMEVNWPGLKHRSHSTGQRYSLLFYQYIW